jgi:LCP family protein required for cell wall assembly
MRHRFARMLIVGVVVALSVATIGEVAVAASTQVAVGRDGRLTLLILGSDRRAGLSGERTDTMMVVTIDPRLHRPVAVSIPRDTARFPNALGYTGKVNDLFHQYDRTRTRAGALQAVKRDFAAALRIEIDYAVLVDFRGFNALIDKIGGIDITLAQTYRDARFQWAANGRRHVGVTFKAGLNHLNGARALIFARSRKGCCPGGGDFGRASRQQMVIMATIRKVAARGPAALPALMTSVRRHIETDLPWTAAPGVYSLVSRANFGLTQRTVFKPSGYATHIPGTTRYLLKLAVVRGYTHRWFAVAR